MPNLFLLPDYFAFIPLLFFIYSLYRSDSLNLRAFAVSLMLYDGLCFIVGGSTFDPIKTSGIILTIIYFGVYYNLRYSPYFILFIIYLFARDVINFIFSDLNIDLNSVRFSVQFFVNLIIIWFLSRILFKGVDLRSRLDLVSRVCVFLISFSFLLSIYQIVAFNVGFPVNGIKSSYSLNVLGEIKYAAYNLGGVSIFRPYALFGEPKFLANVSSVCFIVVLYCMKYGVDSILKIRYLIVAQFSLLVLTASTSAMVSFVLAVIIYFLTNLRISFRGVVFFGIIVFVSNMLFPSLREFIFDFVSNRLLERFSGETGPLESHESFYADRWLADYFNFFLGSGYSYFYEYGFSQGFRSLPNATLIFYGIVGGIGGIFLLILSIYGSLIRVFYFIAFLPLIFVFFPFGSFLILMLFFNAISTCDVEYRSLAKISRFDGVHFKS
ncbi:hypothetical protein [Limnobacter parvus]|uniref:O-antigen polymerase n=1 Tax=Limnobacter parvus TaxID=2939690 RepID=A0ABT1XD58_9BURK|nr:hypothetical protein [Limnobacter parvus]MCR2745212.1 hypothetical protein [Limnobacter parvus]